MIPLQRTESRTTEPNPKIADLEARATLSTLWIFVLLNVIFRDIHEIGRPGFLEEVMTGTVGGVPMTEVLFLQAGIMLEIPIAMVLLPRILPSRIGRWANLLVAPLAIAFVLISGPADLDDIFFASVEVIALLAVVWIAWRWPTTTPRSGGEPVVTSLS